MNDDNGIETVLRGARLLTDVPEAENETARYVCNKCGKVAGSGTGLASHVRRCGATEAKPARPAAKRSRPTTSTKTLQASIEVDRSEGVLDPAAVLATCRQALSPLAPEIRSAILTILGAMLGGK